MLKSISNNFGSPEITFRAAQHDRYVVLNAHFTYDPADAAYIAVQELEIKLPDLSIDKSTEAGIIAVYKDIYESPYGDTYRYHFPAVLRSRIRDRNTLCIEKAAGFDAYGPVHVYIHATYSSLNTGELTELSERTPLTLSCTPEISLSSAAHACVIGPDWAWLYLGFPYTIGQVREDMEIVLDGFPADAACEEFPIMGIDNQHHHDNGGIHYASIRGGRISVPYATRNSGYSSADTPFVYLFLVREPAVQEQEGSESQTI